MQTQKRLKEEERKAYLDPAKSLEAKEKGNACFKEGHLCVISACICTTFHECLVCTWKFPLLPISMYPFLVCISGGAYMHSGL